MCLEVAPRAMIIYSIHTMSPTETGKRNSKEKKRGRFSRHASCEIFKPTQITLQRQCIYRIQKRLIDDCVIEYN